MEYGAVIGWVEDCGAVIGSSVIRLAEQQIA